MSFRSAFVAATAFLASANAHIIMAKPVPYSVDKIDSSPISASQFPCKSQNGFTVSTMNSMAVGEKQTVSFKGTAVHGGGSCQLSVTTDTEPNANSKFKVIMSIEGGCPGVSDKTNEYDFTLPASIPNGKATFAWTWFSKLSGAPELYMNCAPIEVTGGASDSSKFDELPDLFVANINNGCLSPPNKAVQFPNPGAQAQMGNTNDLAPPTGNCGATGNTPPAVSSAVGGSPSAAPPTAPPAAGTGAPTIPTAPAAGGGATCTQNGAVVCNGANQFGLCNNGNVVWQDVAAGTTCSNGTIQKRAAVFHRNLRGRHPHPRVVVPGKEFSSSN
ncbi:hypothetical protein BCR34DRAFT_471561 [Clohesyomyces aquaticus]|uniref:Lytic polysaccharide monooxygenase n=1 Tax=Clohesyomyces aquaticus TaxID=1231657 RepID=A0A1Y2ABI7_9PLEO|nr:hypothetical protein BCR34DRAFT_471561 [Clohesyomyces aquaticus]